MRKKHLIDSVLREADEMPMNGKTENPDIFKDLRDKYIKISMPWIQLEVYLRHTSDYKYDAVLEYVSDESVITSCTLTNVDIENVMLKIHSIGFNSVIDSSFHRFVENDDSLCIAFLSEAAKHKDDLLMLQIKMYNGTTNNEDRKHLSELLRCRILQRLSEKYNKHYVVKADGIDRKCLIYSGYRIGSVFQTDKKGLKKSVWRLNPFKKTAYDASKEDDISITFDEYLAMFDEDDE